LTEQLASFLEDKDEQDQWLKRVNEYLNEIEAPAWQKIIEIIIKETLKPKKYQDMSITQSTS
jgi:hypothetical protein